MSKHYNVVIATPAENINNHYVWSLVNTVKYLDDNNISWIWMNDYSSHVGEVRQRMLDGIVKMSYDKLFWIDSDIHWDVEDFLKLYESDKEFISGCYLTTEMLVAAQNMLGLLITPQELELFDEVHEVKSCGFGFVCMKKGVAEALDRPFLSMQEFNEDVAFCTRAKNETNIPIYLDSTVRLDHFKNLRLGWNRDII